MLRIFNQKILTFLVFAYFKMRKKSWIAFIGTYPPRECGIATFTQDLATAMKKEFSPKFKSKIIAMDNDLSKNFDYPDEVIFRIKDTQTKNYIDVAEEINGIDAIKLVNVQHEFGIFGGEDGELFLEFLKVLKKPVITAFHTVDDDPKPHKKKITQEILNHSNAVVVIINKAKELLQKEYDVDKNKIFVIPHGIHHVIFRRPPKVKSFFNTRNKVVLSTFGLLGGKSKGLDYVIEALPPVINKHPNVIYAIIGTIHPDVLKVNHGKVLAELRTKVKNLGLEKNVIFYNKYLSLRDLLTTLGETDIYLTPYVQKDRKSSGTLAYAMGCGRACISTPFYYAEDIIKDKENGLLVNFKDSKSFTKAILKILDNPKLKKKLETNAYKSTRNMVWGRVVRDYHLINKEILKIK